MSELQELIQKLCPDGVEYKKLGDKQVSIMQRGTSLTKNNTTEGAYPVISGGRVPAFYCDKFNREGETITSEFTSGEEENAVEFVAEDEFTDNAEAISETVENNGDAASYWADTIKDVLLDTQYNCCLKS